MNRMVASARRHNHDEAGWAMIQVIAIGMIMSILVGVMFLITMNELFGARKHRNVTSARQAAEAGVEQAVFEMGQTVAGAPNWDTYAATYKTGASKYTALIGDGKYSGHIDPDPANSANRIITMTGHYPANNTEDARTVKVTVTRGAPPAFDFSMFADNCVTIHNHGGYLAPEIVTTSVHSNGCIGIDHSAKFTLTKMEAVTSLKFSEGGGSTPAGAIPTTGYNWQNPLPNPDVCYPGAYTTTTSCNPALKYSGHATIVGETYANTVEMTSRGQTLPGAAMVTETGQQLPATFGGIKAKTAKLNGVQYSTPGTYTAANCAQCAKGTGATGGQIGGNLVLQANYAPATIPFPSLNYATTYRARALLQSGTHVFTSGTNFLNYVMATANGKYRNVNPTTGELTTWTPGSGTPGAIFLDGDWVLTAGSLSLSWSDILSRAKAATGITTMTQPPVIIVRGSLIAEVGSIDLEAPLIVVGKGNRVDFLKPGPDIDTAKFLDPGALEPGLLAGGGGLDGHDYDSDSDWDDPTKYEPLKASPVIVRGIAYSAKWDAADKVSDPADQHWHNFDPKNRIRIYGAQVGGSLHNCNNFWFTYDPLIKKAYGFGGDGSGVKVIDWQEL